MQYNPRYISLCGLLYVFIDRCISLPLFLLFTDESAVGSCTQSRLHTRNITADIFYVSVKHPVDEVESQLYAFLNLVSGSFIAAAATHCKATRGPFHVR